MHRSVYYNCALLFIFLSGILSARKDIPEISNFTYQLQNLDPVTVGKTGFDLVIMDYSSEGDDESAYTADEIASLKNSSGGQKIILSYLSIGEAEDYRFYWKKNWKPGNPDWLDEENPDWEGNYKVRYWNPVWQAIIYSYLDRILSAGFDGVYLDIIDAYETYLHFSSVQASLEMVRFVKSIREYARYQNSGFVIFVQNAAELADMHPEYLDCVDGIGQEDIYYGYEGDGEATDPAVSREIETCLDKFLNQGKTVLTVDYPFSESEDIPHFDESTLNKITDAYTKSRDRGYIPYCTVRELSYLTINPGYEPTSVKEMVRADCFLLLHNYPNPFNGQTTIRYQLSAGSRVKVRIVDILGREIEVLVDEGQPAGRYRIHWDASGVPSGIYFYEITDGDYHAVKKMELMK
ncbi:endo alpha-1,4 polygalactosaminidase [bacterium]|nr:endo alpha-1,4 polygalactosaminidase [bacterium]